MTTTIGKIDAQMTVNEVLRLYPATLSVFNEYGIDTCCGGALPIGEAAKRHGLNAEKLVDRLRRERAAV